MRKRFKPPKGVRVSSYRVRCQARLWKDCEGEVDVDVFHGGRFRTFGVALRAAGFLSMSEYTWDLVGGVPWCGECIWEAESREHDRIMSAIRTYADKHPGTSATAIRMALGVSRRPFARALKEELSDFREYNWVLKKKGRGLYLVQHTERVEQSRRLQEQEARRAAAATSSL